MALNLLRKWLVLLTVASVGLGCGGDEGSGSIGASFGDGPCDHWEYRLRGTVDGVNLSSDGMHDGVRLGRTQGFASFNYGIAVTYAVSFDVGESFSAGDALPVVSASVEARDGSVFCAGSGTIQFAGYGNSPSASSATFELSDFVRSDDGSCLDPPRGRAVEGSVSGCFSNLATGELGSTVTTCDLIYADPSNPDHVCYEMTTADSLVDALRRRCENENLGPVSATFSEGAACPTPTGEAISCAASFSVLGDVREYKYDIFEDLVVPATGNEATQRQRQVDLYRNLCNRLSGEFTYFE